MRKLIERLLLFFIGLPLFAATILFFPYYNYLVFHIEILIFSVLGILEMRNLISKRLPVHNVVFSVFIGIFIPIAAFLYAVIDIPFRFISFALVLACIIALAAELFSTTDGNFEKSIQRIAGTFLMIIYPGFLVLFLGIMTVWENAGHMLIVFFLMVFGCDSFAWLIGMLFGKNNRGLIAASPNKSIAGFIGGYAGSICAGVAGYLLWPDLFGHSKTKIIILSVLTATAAIIGDIIESILKRSAGIKDSGNLMPGRGGILDCIDSILLAAPVYFIFCDFFYDF
ncbi:phosphatidate cytidylyltransferase [Brucepastera parasyntrophica]|uniref:phosphatidate cytidylyltransferase n=1 Tax=Brucepastera parasyntrophica TaxID=2880008 RepID=UPI00210C27D3|nr:phosphatidate cytidylyltransferase [Brucepastera parasyntrophica]ULQ59963.1 phosphatidate cytidylyltransferase [Brucepastera parasyntrophica]